LKIERWEKGTINNVETIYRQLFLPVMFNWEEQTLSVVSISQKCYEFRA
jgi:hypothetical protein